MSDELKDWYDIVFPMNRSTVADIRRLKPWAIWIVGPFKILGAVCFTLFWWPLVIIAALIFYPIFYPLFCLMEWVDTKIAPAVKQWCHEKFYK